MTVTLLHFGFGDSESSCDSPRLPHNARFHACEHPALVNEGTPLTARQMSTVYEDRKRGPSVQGCDGTARRRSDQARGSTGGEVCLVRRCPKRVFPFNTRMSRDPSRSLIEFTVLHVMNAAVMPTGYNLVVVDVR